MSTIFRNSRRVLACASFMGLMLCILFFLISCAACPPCPPCPTCPPCAACLPCPPEDAVFPVMTPMGPIIVQVDKDFFSEKNRDKYWTTVEDFKKKREKIKKLPDKQTLKEVNPGDST